MHLNATVKVRNLRVKMKYCPNFLPGSSQTQLRHAVLLVPTQRSDGVFRAQAADHRSRLLLRRKAEAQLSGAAGLVQDQLHLQVGRNHSSSPLITSLQQTNKPQSPLNCDLLTLWGQSGSNSSRDKHTLGTILCSLGGISCLASHLQVQTHMTSVMETGECVWG